jgi:hypothetical protein
MDRKAEAVDYIGRYLPPQRLREVMPSRSGRHGYLLQERMARPSFSPSFFGDGLRPILRAGK